MISSLDPSPSLAHGNERPSIEFTPPLLDTVGSGASPTVLAHSRRSEAYGSSASSGTATLPIGEFTTSGSIAY